MQASKPLRAFICTVCGTEFLRPLGPGQPPKYCKDCAPKVHREQIKVSIVKHRRKRSINASPAEAHG